MGRENRGPHGYRRTQFYLTTLTFVGLTASVLGAMKAIKITNLQGKVSGLLNDSRRDELGAARGYRLLGVLGASLGMTAITIKHKSRFTDERPNVAYVPQFLSPVVTFGIFSAIARQQKTTLDPSRLFTSLSLLLILADPLFYLFAGLMELMSARGCLRRVEKFLLLSPKEDPRQVRCGALVQSSHCIDIYCSNIRWSSEGPVILRSAKMQIRTGDIVVISGPVASGKSTLLRLMLGELKDFEGSVSVSSEEIAWCGQSPWLQVSVSSNLPAMKISCGVNTSKVHDRSCSFFMQLGCVDCTLPSRG
jgi:ATP-binding cassette, subfamily C (CFTR/MRP), member 1